MSNTAVTIPADAFEGPEKLLELWLLPEDSLPKGGLRQIARADIEVLLLEINCKILSYILSESMDAYLLSESSLFVFNNKLILKTCGTTTTLLCLDTLFKLVKKYIHWDLKTAPPFKIFYSRRSFMFPDRQNEVHRNWDNEVAFLGRYFSNGDSYIVGRSNRDHWHLYTAGVGFLNLDNLKVSLMLTEEVQKKHIVTKFKDQTFEVLMTKLENVKQFETSKLLQEKSIAEYDGNKVGDLVFHESGLGSLYPKCNSAQHNCFAFLPCGFSSNSIVNGNSYYTLHVTPERGWSYASFETNINSLEVGTNNRVVLNKLMEVFKPGSFCFTIFELKDEFDNHQSSLEMLLRIQINGYKRVEKISYDLDEYELLYVAFELQPC